MNSNIFLKKIFKFLLTIVIIIMLLLYLSIHWQEIKALLNISPSKITFMYFVTFFSTFITGLSNKILLGTLQVKVKYWDMVLLQNAVYLLNYVPMKFGTLFRANYLKKHYNLSYVQFGTFFMYLTLLMTLTAPAVGSVVLLTVYSITKWEVQILLLCFIVSLIISSIMLFVRIPLPKGQNKWSTMIRIFLLNRNNIIKNKKKLFSCAILMNVNFILGAIRLGIIYYSLGQKVHIAGFLILGAVGYLLMFISITPGSIGIRETVLGAASVVIGQSWDIGIIAALIDRAIAITYCFVIGGVSSLILWRKSPQDFKGVTNELSS